MKTMNEYIANYLKWREKEKENEVQERKERKEWYAKKIGSSERLDKLCESDLSELLEKLWALNFWKNKSYKVGRLLQDNTFEGLKHGLMDFLFSDSVIENRWDVFRKRIKGFGPSSLSELLTLVYPDKYGIMNTKPLTVLPKFEYLTDKYMDQINNGFISGKDYVVFMKALDTIKDELTSNGLPDADYLDVDFFVWYLFEFDSDFKEEKVKTGSKTDQIAKQGKEEIDAEQSVTIKGLEITNHTEAENILLKIGKMLGYDTYTPDKSKEAYGEKNESIMTLNDVPQFTTPALMDTIKNIDVIWFKDEFPESCFEIEHTTGVTSGLLRLYQTSNLNAKLFIIAPAEVVRKFDTEMEKKPFNKMRHKYIFKTYEELQELYNVSKKYHEVHRDFFPVDNERNK